MPAEITVQDLAARIREGKPLRIVDVREDWEREIGKLPGDQHIPMNAVPQRMAEFKIADGGEVVVYCHAGMRSMMVAGFLEQNGIPGVLSLAGGIEAWSCEIDPDVPRY
ncbi:MAG TPA: rhodanese-like domain-containing protein [Planctomycetota bacterium]|nr:rhodanese-like domain-containing protein [Planctomycetota bacterium]